VAILLAGPCNACLQETHGSRREQHVGQRRAQWAGWAAPPSCFVSSTCLRPVAAQCHRAALLRSAAAVARASSSTRATTPSCPRSASAFRWANAGAQQAAWQLRAALCVMPAVLAKAGSCHPSFRPGLCLVWSWLVTCCLPAIHCRPWAFTARRTTLVARTSMSAAR